MKKLLHLKRVRLLALIPIAFLFSLFGHLFPQFAEGYAETVYPLFSKAVSRAVSVFPFSLAECLVAAATRHSAREKGKTETARLTALENRG